jgi:hypothetical protein
MPTNAEEPMGDSRAALRRTTRRVLLVQVVTLLLLWLLQSLYHAG